MFNSEQISYLLITPYTIAKSRTGGVVSRLLSRIQLQLIGAQIFAPDEKLARDYADNVYNQVKVRSERVAEMLREYILHSFTPSDGRRHRVMMLLFKGEDACNKLSDIAGALLPENRSIESMRGETIRDTYADLAYQPNNPDVIEYFEPAVLAPRTEIGSRENLRLFAEFMSDQDNLVQNMAYPESQDIERTLVIIKPDNWRYPSSRPGTILDMFSRTGLRIIGCKIYQMSISSALEFYGPVKNVLKSKLGPVFGLKAKELLEAKFELQLDNDVEKALIESFGQAYAIDQFNKIVEFMSGIRPDHLDSEEWDAPGRVKCMVLVYEGVDAVNKIREVLGPTDPTKAPGGTVRREFGSDIMVNTAHASDSPENAEREMKIVNFSKNNTADIILAYLNQ